MIPLNCSNTDSKFSAISDVITSVSNKSNPLGQMVVEFYLSLKKGLHHRVTWWENLKRWGKDAGIGDDGISNKTTRKTWFFLFHFFFGYSCSNLRDGFLDFVFYSIVPAVNTALVCSVA